MTDKTPSFVTVDRALLKKEARSAISTFLTPVIRWFTLPNGDKIMSLRESTLRAGLKAANEALREERAMTRETTKGWEPIVRFSLVSADLGDRDEDMIAIPRWALAVLAGEAADECCGGENHEPGCVKCVAIRTATLASECGI